MSNETEDRTSNSSQSSEVGYVPLSKEEARKKSLSGWNIRCNYCGSYGAVWILNERPGWGALCLCPLHEKGFDEEKSRHDKEISKLRTINYEQDIGV